MRTRSAALGDDDPRSTRDVILDVAERHFAERGFAGSSVRDIATDAGLKNQASLYHHFENKRALYEAVLSRGLAPIIETVIASARAQPRASALVSDDPADAFAPFLDPVIDQLVERPHLPRLIQRAALDDSRYLRTALGRLLRPLYTEGVAAVTLAGSGWEPEDQFHLAAGFYQLIFGYFANANLFEIASGHDPLSKAAVDRQRRFLRRAVAHLLTYAGPKRTTDT